MNQSILRPTKGPWFVRATISPLQGHLTIASTSEIHPIIATVAPKEDGTPNYTDAAVMAAGPHLLEALCAIQMSINARQASAVEINQIISDAFEKIQIEAEV